MKTKYLKIILPLVVLVAGAIGMRGISATAEQETTPQPLDTRLTVKVEALRDTDHRVTIHSYGEVQPLEKIDLSAQVAGEVTSWHPQFLPGGLVRRGEVLFTVEKDAYEAALLSAEAALSQAQAQLIEERARAEVAGQEAKNLPANTKISDLYLRKPQLMSAEAAVKSAQAALKIAQRDLQNCEVRAPFDALVISRSLGVGQFINQGAKVAELSNIEVAEIIVPVAGFDTEFLPATLDNHPVRLTVQGASSITRDGNIVRDLGVIDRNTRMSQLVVRVADPYGLNSNQSTLKFGSYVEVTFAGKLLTNVFQIPQELVANNTVWLVEDEKLVPRKVSVVREEQDAFYIADGLSNQEKIVLTVPEYPQKGMPVKVVTDEEELTALNNQ